MYLYFADQVRGRYSVRGLVSFEKIVPVSHLDLICPTRLYGLRVSLKEEIPLKQFFTPNPPERVRLNTRCSMTRDVWRYDFTKSGLGRNKETACTNIAFMIELELLRNEEFLRNHSDRHIAIHFLGLARDLLGRYNIDSRRETLELKIKE